MVHAHPSHRQGVKAASGDLAGARSYYDRAIAIIEKELGAEYPDLAEMLDGYAALLSRNGEAGAAAAMEARSRAIRAKTAGG